MKQIAMRDFQQKGGAAVKGAGREPILLTGRQGPQYFLVPVQEENIEFQFDELVRAQSLANLRAWQMRAHELGVDAMSDEDIEKEIGSARKARRRHRK